MNICPAVSFVSEISGALATLAFTISCFAFAFAAYSHWKATMVFRDLRRDSDEALAALRQTTGRMRHEAHRL